MNQTRQDLITNLLDKLGQKKSRLEIKIAQAGKRMRKAAAREKASWSDHSIRDAEEEIAILTQQLKTTEAQIKEIKSLSKQKTSSDRAALGSVITIEIDGEKQTFLLIGSPMANFEQGILSTQSPLGKALIGKKGGQNFTISTPTGSLEVKVLGVSSPFPRTKSPSPAKKYPKKRQKQGGK